VSPTANGIEITMGKPPTALGNAPIANRGSESESECKRLTCNEKPTRSQFSLLQEPN